MLDGAEVESVVVNDDVAIEEEAGSTGRRGLAGTLFVHKIAGAAAEEGKSLAEVKRIAETVIANTRTMGLAETYALALYRYLAKERSRCVSCLKRVLAYQPGHHAFAYKLAALDLLGSAVNKQGAQ